MTIAATETNSTDVQGTEILILPMEKSESKKKKKFHRSGYNKVYIYI